MFFLINSGPVDLAATADVEAASSPLFPQISGHLKRRGRRFHVLRNGVQTKSTGPSRGGETPPLPLTLHSATGRVLKDSASDAPITAAQAPQAAFDTLRRPKKPDRSNRTGENVTSRGKRRATLDRPSLKKWVLHKVLCNSPLIMIRKRLPIAAKTLAEQSKISTDRREALWSVEACLRYGGLCRVVESGGKSPHSKALRADTTVDFSNCCQRPV